MNSFCILQKWELKIGGDDPMSTYGRPPLYMSDIAVLNTVHYVDLLLPITCTWEKELLFPAFF